MGNAFYPVIPAEAGIHPVFVGASGRSPASGTLATTNPAWQSGYGCGTTAARA